MFKLNKNGNQTCGDFLSLESRWSKPFKALVSIQVAHLLLFLCQLPETGPRIRVFDRGLPQTTKRRPLCRRFAPSSLRGNLGGTLPGKDKHQPILRLIMNKKKRISCQKCPQAGNTSLKHTETSVTIRSPAACAAALITTQ